MPCEPCTVDTSSGNYIDSSTGSRPGFHSNSTGSNHLGMAPIYSGCYGNASSYPTQHARSNSSGAYHPFYTGTLHSSYDSYNAGNRWNPHTHEYENRHSYSHPHHRDLHYLQANRWNPGTHEYERPNFDDRHYDDGERRDNDYGWAGGYDRSMIPLSGRSRYGYGNYGGWGRGGFGNGYGHGVSGGGGWNGFGGVYGGRGRYGYGGYGWDSPVMTSPAFALSRSRAAVRPGTHF